MSDGTELKKDGRVITVRLPSELHRQLRVAAALHELSVNAFCVKVLGAAVSSGDPVDQNLSGE